MKRKLLICVFMFCAFSAFSLGTAPFSNPDAPMQNQTTGINSTQFPQFGEYKGSASSPFQQESLISSPILYGPGGDPIGGLPVKNGTQILFLIVIGYAIFKLIQIRLKKIKG